MEKTKLKTGYEWGISGQPSTQSLIACIAMSSVMISDLLLSPMSRLELHCLLMIRGVPSAAFKIAYHNLADT